MPDFLILSCPSCGHKLQITDDMDRFACAVCGNEHIVNRSDDIVTLIPVVDGIKKVQAEVDKAGSDLASARLQTEIEDLKRKAQAIHTSKSVGERGILVAGLFIILAIILLYFDSTRVVGLFIIVATILIYIFLQLETTEEKEIDNELKNFINELEMKEKELQENRQTISKI